MTTYAEAVDLLLAAVPEGRKIEVPLDQAAGHFLAEDITADVDLPSFDKALMDGFAVRSADSARGWTRVRVIGEVPAGAVPSLRVGPAEAVRIMTGAPIPEGADAVKALEECEELPPTEAILRATANAGENILRRGSEIRRGERLLAASDPLTPGRIGLLAAVGRASVSVYRSPRVVIVPTGDELFLPGDQTRSAGIFDSNGAMLAVQARRLATRTVRESPVRDSMEQLGEVLARNRNADILVFSGGVSAGDRDFVPDAVRADGYDVVFHRCAIRPGKPVLVARKGVQMAFGLPGNPVSSFVTFELFVRTAVRKLMGAREPQLPRIRARLLGAVRQRPGRLSFKPARVRFRNGEVLVEPLSFQGSSDLVHFADATALIEVPAEVDALEEGALVDVICLPEGDCP